MRNLRTWRENQPLLVYGHYDVQPAEPLEPLGLSALRAGGAGRQSLRAGATDDKGQVLTHVFGVQSWMATQGRLPLNVKFLIEGEEEVGSAALEEYLPGHTERLACDCVVISDGSQFAPGQPAITYGLRGLAYFELLLHGPNRDLHSGSFGGSVSNPANALAKMLAALVDERGRIRLPGFYDDVIPPTAREREQFARLPFDEKQYFAQLDVAGAVGEEGYTALEAPLDPAHVRHPRPLERLPGQRHQNGAAGGSGGEIQFPPGAEPGPGQNRRSGPRDAPIALPGRDPHGVD